MNEFDEPADKFTAAKERYKERMMEGFWYLVKIGILVPALDAQGKPRLRDGEVVYQKTTDPKTQARYPQYFVNNN